MELLKDPKFDFLGKARFFVPASVLVVIGSIALVATQGLRYGVEFSGGTQLIVQFSERPELDKIRDAVGEVVPGAVIQTYDEPSKHEVLIRLADTGESPAATTEPGSDGSDAAAPGGAVERTEEVSGEPTEEASVQPTEGASESRLGALAEKTLDALATRYATNAVVESSAEIVGPIVGAELRRKAVQLTVLALLFQLIYIGIRFKGPVWGTGAAVAVIHDVLVTLGVLTLAGYEITLNVIAALLTIVGYSVNDTIVIFDRARENLRQRRKTPLATVVNDSVNQTLSRTVITSATTFFAVLALYLFGGEVLRGFAFTMVIGVVVGTYSTIYIASPLVVWWRGRGVKPGSDAKAA
jgi:preprotein translocase subunit SecF